MGRVQVTTAVESSWPDEEPVPFLGEWSECRDGDAYMPARTAGVGHLLIADAVEDSPGSEVIIQMGCYTNPGFGQHAMASEVNVFAGNSRQVRQLGQLLPGSFETLRKIVVLDPPYGVPGSVSTSEWEKLESDAACCPSKSVVTEWRWNRGEWSEVE